MPEKTKNVTRTSRWGNPFKLKQHGGINTLNSSLYKYEMWLNNKLRADPDFLKPLVGYNLGCFCKLDDSCHADILLEYLEIQK